MTELNQDKVYYLASPYSHVERRVVDFRYKEQQRLHSALISKYKATILAPIEQCHNLTRNFDLPSGYEFWKKRDRKFIDMSDGIVICLMEGWKESVGVSDELAYAKAKGKEVYFLDPESLKLSKLNYPGVKNERV